MGDDNNRFREFYLKNMENTSWWQHEESETTTAAKISITLTANDLQYPERLSTHILREYLVKRCIIESGDTTKDKEFLLQLFRNHISPLPQRNESVNKLNAEVKAVTLNRSFPYDKSRYGNTQVFLIKFYHFYYLDYFSVIFL